MFVRKISTYENAQGVERVLVTFQSSPITEATALFAVKLSEDTKIGCISLQKGISIEDAKKSIALGADFSANFKWGEKKADQADDSMLHDIETV